MPNARSFRPLIVQVLTQVLGRDVTLDYCRMVTGSLARRTFRVETGGERYVVRLGRAFFGRTLAVDTEVELMRSAAAAGIAPDAVGADWLTGSLVTRYLADSRVWSVGSARRPRNMLRLAATLRKLHALEVRLPEFNAERYARFYLEWAHHREPHDDMSARLAQELLLLARKYDGRFDSTTVCHNDLVAENVLDAGEPKLVDFEYAVLADPVLDLASVAAMNRYDARRRLQVVEAYYPNGGRPFSVSEFDDVVRMLNLLAHFWARAQDEERRAMVPEYSDPVRLLTAWP